MPKSQPAAKRPDWISDEAIISDDSMVDRFEGRFLKLIKDYGIFSCLKLKEQDPGCYGYYAIAQGYIGGLTDQQRERDSLREYSRIVDAKIKVAVKKNLKDDHQSEMIQKMARTAPQGTYVERIDFTLFVEADQLNYILGDNADAIAHNTRIFNDSCRTVNQYIEDMFDRGSDTIRADFFQAGTMPEHANNYLRREPDFQEAMAYFVELYDIPAPAEIALKFQGLVEAAKADLITPAGFHSSTVFKLLKDIDDLHMDEVHDLASITVLLINICTYRGDHDIKALGQRLKENNITLPIFCDAWVTHETALKHAQSFISQRGILCALV